MSDLYRIDWIAGDEQRYKRYVDDLIDNYVLVKVEPTDRICTEHGELTHAGATACEGGPEPSFHWWDECVMFDVVRDSK